MKDMGIADVILEFKINKTQDGIILSRFHYAEKMLKKINAYNGPIVEQPCI